MVSESERRTWILAVSDSCIVLGIDELCGRTVRRGVK